MIPRSILHVALLGLAVHAHAAPNVIFILADDHGPNAISSVRPHLPAYGNHLQNLTPNLDRIATHGAIFSNTYCENSICGPSRAAILTGKYSHINGNFGNATGGFDPNQQHLAKLLRDGGHDTAIFGKWHLKFNGSNATPTGFNTFAILSSAEGQGHYYAPVYNSSVGNLNAPTGTYCDNLATDWSLDWLNGSVTLDGTPQPRDTSKPFALFCHYKAPHRSWIPAPEEIGLWRDFDGSPGNDVGFDPTWPAPATLHEAASSWPGRSNAIDNNRMTIQSHLNNGDLKLNLTERSRMTSAQQAAWDALYQPENDWYNANLAALPDSHPDKVRWKYERYSKDYLRCVAGVDRNVGRILDWLDAQPANVRDNTIVIYSGDQGFFVGDHGLYDKRWMYEESLRMPLLIRWPARIQPGTVIDAPIQNIDFAPFVLNAVGLPVPRDMQGRSFVPMATGTPQPDWRKAIYYHYHDGSNAAHGVVRHDGVRTATDKLIRFNEPGFTGWEMYDLANDPDELQNIANNPGAAARRGELEALLEQLRREARIPGASPLRAHENFRD